MNNSISSGVKKANKTKIFAIVFVSLVVFFTTLFALAENKNGNSLFLDSDQDGLTDQEEKAFGTNPDQADTDGDGYSDGKEVASGFNPLKPAPGDKIVVGAESNPQNGGNAESENSLEQNLTEKLLSGSETDLLGTGFGGLTDATLNDFSSDPENPNLTNEMLGQLMQLSKEKSSTSESFSSNPTFSAEDYGKVVQQSLESTNTTKTLPEIRDDEIKVLPAIDGKNLKPEEVKEKQKAEIEKYLASVAFIFASYSPFPVTDTSQFQTDIDTESTNFLNTLLKGDRQKIDAYAEKAQASIDQIKKIEVPYVLKDFHKSALALAIYTVDMKDDVVINTTDPMKSLASLSTLQKVAEEATKLQDELKSVLDQYGVEFINFP